MIFQEEKDKNELSWVKLRANNRGFWTYILKNNKEGISSLLPAAISQVLQGSFGVQVIKAWNMGPWTLGA